MTVVTGDQVFEAFKADPRINGEDDPQLKMLEPFIKALPNVLGDMLDKPVDLALLFDAKIRFMQYCLDNDLIKHATVALKDVLGDDLGMIETLKELLTQMVEMAPRLTEILAEQGLTEDELLVSDKVGLNEAMLARLRAGNLTLGDLLVNQPGVVIIND